MLLNIIRRNNAELKIVLENLCAYDKRNPDYLFEEDEPIKPRESCFCDNCFYGRNKLAVEILRLLNKEF